ncbi:hypothetical protein [Coleofasciculus chthonoplastes]|uniref:hypothetical protein n=1 Tax=Coleofasciculus chthonoplastes TaxID=64178 RepID=UPI003300CD52
MYISCIPIVYPSTVSGDRLTENRAIALYRHWGRIGIKGFLELGIQQQKDWTIE